MPSVTGHRPAGAPAAPTSTDRTTDDAFLDLVCRDEELVRAEFDALIAASWHLPPPPPPAAPRPADRPPGWPVAPAPGPPPMSRRSAPSGARFNRQRSPPRRLDGKGR